MERIEIRHPADLGLAVSEARRAVGLTQEELAEQTGLQRTYLVKLENGLTTLLIERSLRVLRRLGARLVVEFPAADASPRGGD